MSDAGAGAAYFDGEGDSRRARRERAMAGNIGRNSAIMAVGTLGSRVLGLVRMSMLSLVVIGAAADSFTMANTLPTQLYVLINGGLLSAMLIPLISKAMLRKDGGQDFSDRLITLCLLVLGGVTLISLALAPWILGALTRKGDGDFLAMGTALAYICLPQIFFYGLYSVLGQVLNARGQFLAYAWAPAWANVVQIAGLAWFIQEWGKQSSPKAWTSEMTWVLGGTTTLGIAVQGLALVLPLLRSGFKFTPRFGWRGYGFGEVSRMSSWTLGALVVSQAFGFFSTWVMQVAADDSGRVPGNAAQQWAYSIYILPYSLITVSIITAIFPAMSRAHAKGDDPAMRHWITRGLVSPAVLIIPATAAMIALGRPLAATLFPGTRYVPSRGIDEPGDIAIILAIMALGTLAFGITAVKQRYCFARGDGPLNFWTVVLMIAVNVVACFLALWVTPAEYVIAVVAGGATMGNIVSAAVFLWIARRQLGGLNLSTVTRLWARLSAAAALAGLVGWGVATMVADPASDWIRQALALASGGLALGAMFYLGARLLKIREVDEMLAPILRRLPLPR